jgi:hypothetical protein
MPLAILRTKSKVIAYGNSAGRSIGSQRNGFCFLRLAVRRPNQAGGGLVLSYSRILTLVAMLIEL